LYKNEVEVIQVLLSRITFEFRTISLLMHNPPPKKGLKAYNTTHAIQYKYTMKIKFRYHDNIIDILLIG